MRTFLTACLMTVMVLSVFSAETDFWFEETKLGGNDQPAFVKRDAAKSSADVFDTITKEEGDVKEVASSSEETTELNNRKPGPSAHLMLQAFDEDGDGVLDSSELAKINKKAWLNFHKGMTNKVFNALGGAAPEMQKSKRDVAQTYSSVQRGDLAPNVAKKLASENFNPRSLQTQFENRIKSAAHVAADWKDETRSQPHLELHKKTIEHARALIAKKK